jgi:hypothetical protein
MSERTNADSQMEVLHIKFPFNKLPREWKLICWGLCCLVGFFWRHVELYSGGDNKWQEQGEHNESECGDEDECLTGE